MEYPSDGYEDTDTGSGGNLLAQIPNILWHRKWWIIVPAVLGTWIGFQIQDRIDQRAFRKATLAILMIAGLNLLRRGLMG